MSSIAELKKKLTEEQRAFYKNKILSSTMKVESWISFLSIVSLLDKKGDKRTKTLNELTIGSLLLILFSIFATIISKKLYFLLGIPLFTVVAISLYIHKKKHEGNDLNNYLRLFFIPILHVLKDKAGSKAKLSAKIDFRNPRNANEPKKSKVNGRKQSLYTPTYITAKILLQDNVLLAFMFREDIKDLEWRKRNPRGKIKYKSKTKIVHHCLFNLRFPTSEYLWLGKTLENTFITKEDDYYLVKSKIKVKRIGDDYLHVKVFLDNIKAIYELFKPTAQQEKANNIRRQEEDDSFLESYVWYGGYFERYDYDSFDHAYYEHGVYDEKASVFDS